MPRQARNTPGGIIYHVLNRANGRLRLFKKDEDFLAFERVLRDAHAQVPIRILAWCILPNHWHLVLWPRADGELTAFMRKLTHTHTQRWKPAHDAIGQEHLYQGRFKSFPVQEDEHLLTLLRYVERNPLRAKLTPRAQDWRWGSLYVRGQRKHDLHGLCAPWPIAKPRDWTRWANRPQTPAEEKGLKTHITRSRPLGSEEWTQKIVARLSLQHTLRPPGRQVGWRKSNTVIS